ncbi:MAG: hypothetical protein V2B18_08450 [Pseudomonadota bacterium]
MNNQAPQFETAGSRKPHQPEPSLIKSIRRAVSPPGKRGLSIAGLADDLLMEIRKLHQQGNSPTYIARLVTQSWNQCEDVPFGTVRSSIVKFIERMGDHEYRETADKVPAQPGDGDVSIGVRAEDSNTTPVMEPSAVAEPEARADLRKESTGVAEVPLPARVAPGPERLHDPLEGLSKLLEVQWARLQRFIEMEKSDDAPVKLVDQVVDSLRHLETDYIKSATALGALKQNPEGGEDPDLTKAHEFLQDNVREPTALRCLVNEFVKRLDGLVLQGDQSSHDE